MAPVSNKACGVFWTLSSLWYASLSGGYMTENGSTMWGDPRNQSGGIPPERIPGFYPRMQPYLLVDPITIRFDTTVKSVSVALACLNYGSYHLAVYDGADSLLSEREVASPPCQIAPVYETIEAKRIRRVVITTPIMPPGVPELPNQTKPTREYPYMMVSFIPDDCIAPDSVLNNRQVREGLDRELKQSIADSLERSGWLFRNSGTGEYVVQYYSTPTLQTPCNVDTPLHPNFPLVKVSKRLPPSILTR